MSRGIATIQQLRARCDCTSIPGCWLWQGGRDSKGQLPKIWTFDHSIGDKRTITGPRAVWNIAYSAAPAATDCIYRACLHNRCLRPEHLRLAKTRAEIGAHIKRLGVSVGTQIETRRANIRKAHAHVGMVYTPADVVRAVRAAAPSVTNADLSRLHGIKSTTVSKIRRGQSHRDLLTPHQGAGTP